MGRIVPVIRGKHVMHTGGMIMLNHYQEKILRVKKRETSEYGNETGLGCIL